MKNTKAICGALFSDFSVSTTKTGVLLAFTLASLSDSSLSTTKPAIIHLLMNWNKVWAMESISFGIECRKLELAFMFISSLLQIHDRGVYLITKSMSRPVKINVGETSVSYACWVAARNGSLLSLSWSNFHSWWCSLWNQREPCSAEDGRPLWCHIKWSRWIDSAFHKLYLCVLLHEVLNQEPTTVVVIGDLLTCRHTPWICRTKVWGCTTQIAFSGLTSELYLGQNPGLGWQLVVALFYVQILCHPDLHLSLFKLS